MCERSPDTFEMRIYFPSLKRLIMKWSCLLMFIAVVLNSDTLLAQNVAKPGYQFSPADTLVQKGMVMNGRHSTRVHIRAARDFEKRFSGRSATWHQSNDTVVARFTADAITTFAGYGKSGKWLYTLRCLFEWQVPQEIRHEVKSMFNDSQIKIVYELAFSQNINIIYLFYLTDMNSNQKVIRWSENGIEIVKGFTHIY
jgi:hypothetical protein